MNTPKQTFSDETKSVLHNSPARDKIKANRTKFRCPVCKRQLLFLLVPDTEVKNLPVWCKTCKREVIVNISLSHLP